MTRPTELRFRAAVEAWDHAAVVDSLAPDVKLYSPITFRPFEGREVVGQVLATILETFEDFRYVAQLDGDGIHALEFRTRIGDREIHGIDLIRVDDDGLVDDFTVMIRPASAQMALAEAMRPTIEGLKAAAP